MKIKPGFFGVLERDPRKGWTLLEVAVVIALLSLLGFALAPGFAGTQAQTKTAVCSRNLHALTIAWAMYADENSGGLIAANYGIQGRPPWLAETVEEVFAIVRNGTLYPYTGRDLQVYRCPADSTKLISGGIARPSPRSYSMSHVFGTGGFLDGGYNPAQTVWRTYARQGEIVLPARTFLFVDEHPDSINDGAFANTCTGAQPGDSPGAAQIIDFPANYHNGGCSFSFGDGHTETHLWVGAKFRNLPVSASGTFPPNGPAGSSWIDVQWLAARTTVRR